MLDPTRSVDGVPVAAMVLVCDDSSWSATGALTTNGVTTLAQATVSNGVSLCNCLTDLHYQNTSATATLIEVLDGTKVLAAYDAPANMSMPVVLSFRTPLRASPGNALNIQAVTSGANVLTNASGYQL